MESLRSTPEIAGKFVNQCEGQRDWDFPNFMMNSIQPLDKAILLDIDCNIRKSELKSLKFLSRDFVSDGKLEEIKHSYELFDVLVNKDCNPSDRRLIVSQFLYLIGRNDLIKNKLNMEYRSVADVVEKSAYLDRFRILLFELSKNMVKNNVNKLKFCFRTFLKKTCLEEIEDGEDLLSALETVFPDKNTLLNHLEQCFITAECYDLIKIVSKFKIEPNEFSTNPSCASLQSEYSPPEPSRYPMDNHPRGICLIINNEIFETSEYRIGTDVDADAIEKLFKSLDFHVIKHKDLCSKKMKHEIKKLGESNHQHYDCFFAFILSHGKPFSVLGTDGEELSLRSILSPFKSKNCPSLKDKPKVFCIQACQGKDTVESDLASDCPKEFILIEEPNFCLSLSTLPGFLSVRSRSNGTWYITALLEVIREYHKRLDFMKMLTMVTDKVNKNSGNIGNMKLCQVPVPMSTLTRDLYLF